jgi:hypothetical protein
LASKTLSLVEEILSIRVQQDLTEKFPSELHGHMSLSSFPTELSLAPALGAIDDIVALKGAN